MVGGWGVEDGCGWLGCGGWGWVAGVWRMGVEGGAVGWGGGEQWGGGWGVDG